MTVLLQTCIRMVLLCLQGRQFQSKERWEEVTEQLRQLFALLWALGNIPLSLNELPGDAALDSTC